MSTLNENNRQGEYIYSAEVTYDIDYLKDFRATFHSKFYIITSIVYSLCLVYGVLLLVYLTNYAYGSVLIIISIIGFFRNYTLWKKISKLHNDSLMNEPNKRFTYYFYLNHVHIEMKSDVSSSNLDIPYSNIRRVVDKKDYIFFRYLNTYYAISKKSLGNDSTALFNFLRGRVEDPNKDLKKSPK